MGVLLVSDRRTGFGLTLYPNRIWLFNFNVALIIRCSVPVFLVRYLFRFFVGYVPSYSVHMMLRYMAVPLHHPRLHSRLFPFTVPFCFFLPLRLQLFRFPAVFDCLLLSVSTIICCPDQCISTEHYSFYTFICRSVLDILYCSSLIRMLIQLPTKTSWKWEFFFFWQLKFWDFTYEADSF